MHWTQRDEAEYATMLKQSESAEMQMLRAELAVSRAANATLEKDRTRWVLRCGEYRTWRNRFAWLAAAASLWALAATLCAMGVL